MPETGNNVASQQSLSIRVGTDGFSFSAYAPLKSDGEMYRRAEFALRPTVSLYENVHDALATTPLLNEEFAYVRVAVSAPAVFLPRSDFHAEEADTIYLHNVPDSEGMHIFFNVLPQTDCMVLFALDMGVYEQLLGHFPQSHYYSIHTGVLEHLQPRSRVGERRKLYAYFHDKQMSIYYFSNGRLQLANTFYVSEMADACYYLLSVWQTFKLNQEKDELDILGNPANGVELTDALQKYLRNVFVIKPSAEFNRARLANVKDVPYDVLALLLNGM